MQPNLSEDKMKKLMLLRHTVTSGKHIGGLPIGRRYIRRQLFRIRDHMQFDEKEGEWQVQEGAENSDHFSNGLKEWIESQFKKNIQQNWDSFTFTWDVAPDDPFTIITKEQWSQRGGKMDADTGIRHPAGFTEQEK